MPTPRLTLACLAVALWTTAGLAAETDPMPTGEASPSASPAAIASPEPDVPAERACPLGAIGVIGSGGPRWEDDPVVPPKKTAWENSLGGQEAARPFVRARLTGWPARVLVDRATLPTEDQAFLERLARDTWRGLDTLTDRENGLPVDHVRLGGGGDGSEDARVGDYTNVTNVGLHLVAVVAAFEIGLIDAAQGRERIARTLDTLDGLETYDGYFFNYYDTTSLERTSNFLSFVDTSWLTAGLIVVRNAFPDLAGRASRLIDRLDYGFFYDPKQRQMSHGYYVHRRARSRYHYGMLYTEARLGAVIAIGKGEVPESVWFDMVRTYPPACAGQSGTPKGSHEKTVRGHTVLAGYYEWGGLRYVPSWGGSMFEALMPTLVLDEGRLAPRSLGPNGLAHATIQRRWATEELRYPVWGMSACATPVGDDYGEYGVRILGARGYRAGAVTPHATALALLATPRDTITALHELARRYDAYGDFGFYDALDPFSGTVARTYLALDQSMLFIALANHLKDGCVQRRFAADPIVQRALPVIAAEDFFE